jgi:polysaccharide export outer membrane protein
MVESFMVPGISRNCDAHVSGWRRMAIASLAAVAVVQFAGCAFAPGMRMHGVSNSSDNIAPDSGKKGSPALPVTEISAATINRFAINARLQSAQFVRQFSGRASSYVVGPADVLQIIVWDHPELVAGLSGQPTSTSRAADAAPGVVVDEDGYIQFPYAGRLHVAGMSMAEIQTRLIAALSKFYLNPQVTVRIASFRAKQVYIDGEVHAPGMQLLNDVPMTLPEAIGRAGGFTADADQGRLSLIRDGHSYSLDMRGMITRGENPSDVMLRRGDILRVMSREESGVYVMGEVNKPLTAVPKQDGRLTLADALSQAGSFNASTSDPKQLYVVRGAQTGRPEIFHLDARSPVSMVLASRFQLEPNDVVYVDASDLVRVSRVLALLLPAIGTGITADIATK